MHRRHLRFWAGLALAAGLVVGCADNSPTGLEMETPAPQHSLGSLTGSLLGTVGRVAQRVGLVSCSPLPYDSVAVTVGPQGGSVPVGPHRLAVPPGALSTPVRITAVAPVGTVNLVRFQPEGLHFAVPATLTMSYENCGLVGSLLPGRIAHVSDDLQILEYLVTVLTVSGTSVTGQLNHFSNYAVAW